MSRKSLVSIDVPEVPGEGYEGALGLGEEYEKALGPGEDQEEVLEKQGKDLELQTGPYRRRVMSISADADVDREVNRGLSRLDQFQSLYVRAAGRAIGKAVEVILGILDRCGQAQWLARRFGGDMPVIEARLRVRWLTDLSVSSPGS